ncbi:hypothetical protein OSCT_1080 [Oscillochloris trichoides DG-6]|uniref:Uncharacterized protein n=1 Tax=Oscillochloris trichoides DG-6 TaxID=765420 RepID=E1ICM9_9CHLR|nr:hypothetical protein [Oscillochloris trichoides]EFO81049.1 hypothetical protein OSCT_1080 [Oscillochloris trichoides DG-6]
MANYDQKKPYSWMPEGLRRFLNLEYDDAPATGSSSSAASYSTAPAASYSAAPAPAASSGWTAPSNPSFQASNMSGYTPPASSGYSAPTFQPATGNGGSPAVSGQFDVLSITGALRGFVHGALPPQGVEQFSKELVGTTRSVFDMYSRWFFFQTEDVLKLGQSVIKTVTDLLPTGPAQGTQARRIKVMVSNGDQEETPIKVEA